MINITPNKNHAIIEANLAISNEHPTNAEDTADKLNESLRESVNDGLLSDFIFKHSDQPLMVKASDAPQPGELFYSANKSNIAMLEALTKEVIYWCAHRQSKNRVLNDTNMNVDCFVRSFLRGNRDYSQAMKENA